MKKVMPAAPKNMLAATKPPKPMVVKKKKGKKKPAEATVKDYLKGM